jgi:hypothetical protein
MDQSAQGGVSGMMDVKCMIPADAQPNGFIAFTYITDPGQDSSIDIEFSLVGPGWGLETTRQEFQSMHWAVTLQPGQQNTLRFSLDKGGTIKGSDEIPRNFGGGGMVLFQNIIVFFQRASREQEHWRWCHKCQSLFFQDNTPNKCPSGGSHEATGGKSSSGDYQLIVR